MDTRQPLRPIIEFNTELARRIADHTHETVLQASDELLKERRPVTRVITQDQQNALENIINVVSQGAGENHNEIALLIAVRMVITAFNEGTGREVIK